MLSSRREQWIVFLGVVAVNAALGLYLFRRWRDYQVQTRWIYRQVTATEGSGLSSPSARKLQDQDLSIIVTRNLFRQDRASESATENAKMPELPILYGTMNLGNGSFALMVAGSQASAPSKQVFLGDEIGGYKLVSIAGSRVVVAWGEKKITIDAAESARRVSPVGEKTASPPAARPEVSVPAATSTSRVTTVAPSTGAVAGRSGSAGYNAPPGAPADAPAGTIINGKKKVVEKLFGMEKTFWVDVPKPTETPEKPNPKQP